MNRSRAISSAVLCLFVLAATAIIQAQTYTVLHTFSGPDGSTPAAGLTIDQGGNLYGTASLGGNTGNACASDGCGTVFKLARKGANWIFTPLYIFSSADGSQPFSRVLFGPDGKLYGTTNFGGAHGYGTVFSLQPPPTICRTTYCLWHETVLHSFSGGDDGAYPSYGDLAFDAAGNIYGTAWGGGSNNAGVVYKLSSSQGVWTETVLHSFGAGADGTEPTSGVVLDGAGNLYGTTTFGGSSGAGVVYKLAVGSGWRETILYSFNYGNDGGEPFAGLTFDNSGNLFGITYVGGFFDGGTVFELTPSQGAWTFNVLYSVDAYEGSFSKLFLDSAGNLNGTITQGSQEVFRLTNSDGQWNLTGFSGSEGSDPSGNVVMDTGGNLYTTAQEVGTQGIVFELTP